MALQPIHRSSHRTAQDRPSVDASVNDAQIPVPTHLSWAGFKNLEDVPYVLKRKGGIADSNTGSEERGFGLVRRFPVGCWGEANLWAGVSSWTKEAS